MNRIEAVHPYDLFNESELAELRALLAKSHASEIPLGQVGESEVVADDVSETALDEFLDRLRPSNAVADVYVPVPFEGVHVVAGMTCASAQRLLKALDALRSSLELDDDADARDRRLAKQRNLWRAFRRGARDAINKKLMLALVRL